MRYLATSYKKEFSNPDLKVFFHFETFYEPMFVHGAATTYRLVIQGIDPHVEL